MKSPEVKKGPLLTRISDKNDSEIVDDSQRNREKHSETYESSFYDETLSSGTQSFINSQVPFCSQRNIVKDQGLKRAWDD